MREKKLKDGKSISLIGFGTMGISEFYGQTDLEVAQQSLRGALENGINHFDTADNYAFGDNEIFLGDYFDFQHHPELRHKIILASKAGILRDRLDPTIRGVSIDPKYLKQQLMQSLKNLQTDYLDIFYVHRVLPKASDTELKKLAEFLLEIKQLGLVKSVGLSEPRLDQLSLIHEYCQVEFVQSEYSLLERVVEQNGILDFCQANEINFVAYSPLCRGMLTDGFDPMSLHEGDVRLTLPKFQGDNFEFNKTVLSQLKQFAYGKQVSLSTLAIAWLLQRGVLVIPGMRKPSRVIEAVSALQLNLSHDDLAVLDEISPYGALKGTRYAQYAMEVYGFE